MDNKTCFVNDYFTEKRPLLFLYDFTYTENNEFLHRKFWNSVFLLIDRLHTQAKSTQFAQLLNNCRMRSCLYQVC